jgi:hypothetical protein
MAISRRDAIAISVPRLPACRSARIGGDALSAQAPPQGAPDSRGQTRWWSGRSVLDSRCAAVECGRLGTRAPGLRSRGDLGSADVANTRSAGTAIDFDYTKMAIKVDTRGLGKLAGTMHFSDLEKLPAVSHTFLLQCGAPNPRGIVKWTASASATWPTCLGSCRACTIAGSSRRIGTTWTRR